MKEHMKYSRWAQSLVSSSHIPNAPFYFASDRIKSNDFMSCFIQPKFTFAKSAKVYAIGSCFAREIESTLQGSGLRVLSSEFAPPEGTEITIFEESKKEYIPGNEKTKVFTKFNPHSIFAELSICLENKDWPLVEVSEGKYWNAQLHGVPIQEKRACLAISEAVKNTVVKIKQADIVIITLGLTEYWQDRSSGLATNGTPSPKIKFQGKRRFLPKNSSFQQSKSAIRKSIELVRKVNPNVNFILSVSPIPLQRTFSEKDIIVANCYSKSQLRMVAEMLTEEFDYVDYFPSYEMVLNSNPQKAWLKDRRHVSRDMVNFVTSTFVDAYIQ